MKKWMIYFAIIIPLLAFLVWWENKEYIRNNPFKGDLLKCAMSLKFIADAKDSYQNKHPESLGQVIPLSELQQYVGLPDIRVCTNCPSGGVIHINPIGEPPTCSIPDHQNGFKHIYQAIQKKR